MGIKTQLPRKKDTRTLLKRHNELEIINCKLYRGNTSRKILPEAITNMSRSQGGNT